MTNKELKQKFPIGKLYQIKIHCGIFSALVNKSCELLTGQACELLKSLSLEL